MSQTTSRIELTNILAEILHGVQPSLIAQVCYLTQGKLHPDFEGIEIGLAEKSVAKAVQKAYDVSDRQILESLRKLGDLGSVVEQISQKQTQASLFPDKLTVQQVYDTLNEIAKTAGKGSSEARVTRLAALFRSATSLEAKFLTRFVTGKLRLGVADYTVLDALAVAFTGDKKNRKVLERAYNLTSDLGYVAQLVSGKEGLKAVQKVRATAGKPIRPMLAERMTSSQAIIDQMGGEAAAEYKLDGERIQAHKIGNDISLFSRRLERIDSHYPDVAVSLGALDAHSLIIEGEVVALDAQGKYLPFQELMHRRRKYGVEEAIEKYPAALNVFDILFLEGRQIIDLPYYQRRSLLEDVVKNAEEVDASKLLIVPAKSVKSADEIDAVMTESLAAGCEGLVIKSRSSTYRAGAREFSWIKFKPEYRPGVADTLDLVIVGANHGMGRRAGHYGTFLLAAYDKDKDLFRTTTKVGTGFTDLDLEHISKRLSDLKIEQKNPRVDAKVTPDDWFEPKIVIEVLASEITLSPTYTAGYGKIREDSGLALRFPKFTGKIRTDKAPEDATTVTELVEMYQKQTRQYKSKGPDKG
jgi:DNA ligase 1